MSSYSKKDQRKREKKRLKDYKVKLREMFECIDSIPEEYFVRPNTVDGCRNIIELSKKVYQLQTRISYIEKLPDLRSSPKYWKDMSHMKSIEETATYKQIEYLKKWQDRFYKYHWGMESLWLYGAISKVEEQLDDEIWKVKCRVAKLRAYQNNIKPRDATILVV